MTRPKPWRDMPPATLMLAGVSVRREHVAWLAGTADGPVSDRLHRALEYGTRIVALAIDDEHALLRALEDCPDHGLGELRGALLREHEQRQRMNTPPS